MEEKLKSISKRIPWSLLLRAVVFGAGWLILPFWAFLALALGLYFIPFFQVWKLFFPFALTLVLAFLVPQGIWTAIFLSGLFFFILGVKDLFLIDRAAAFRFLLYIFLFIAFFYSFSHFDSGLSSASFFWFFVLSLLFAFLLGNFFVYSNLGAEKKRFRSVAIALLGLMLFELSLAVLFLPLDLLAATVLVFVSAVILFELAADYFSGQLTPLRIMGYGTIFLTVFALILASQNFSI